MLEGPTNWSSFGVGLLEGPKRIPLLCVGAINRYLHGKRRGRFNRSLLVFAGSRQEHILPSGHFGRHTGTASV